ncbi:MAG: hypothetical protein KDD25_05600, partial [Bdellovibrionales bacterium]|nr:hypothetical protein [Bdellovibrionales bacterium]
NLKSRAQLIVWCMPHQNFVEDEARVAQNQTNIANPADANTIPRGNTTVGAPIGGLPQSGIGGTNNNGGNTGSNNGGFGY